MRRMPERGMRPGAIDDGVLGEKREVYRQVVGVNEQHAGVAPMRGRRGNEFSYIGRDRTFFVNAEIDQERGEWPGSVPQQFEFCGGFSYMGCYGVWPLEEILG